MLQTYWIIQWTHCSKSKLDFQYWKTSLWILQHFIVNPTLCFQHRKLSVADRLFYENVSNESMSINPLVTIIIFGTVEKLAIFILMVYIRMEFHLVFLTFLLLWKDTVTKTTYRRSYKGFVVWRDEAMIIKEGSGAAERQANRRDNWDLTSILKHNHEAEES